MSFKETFLYQFIKNPLSIGAVSPSSIFLARKMMEGIDFQKAECIVEYGPGTGVFTEELLRRRSPGTFVLLVESNLKFYRLLKKKFQNEINFYIVHGSAEDVKRHLAKYGITEVDYVVSGLPFTSLPDGVSSRILESTVQVLSEEGQFITFQYTRARKAFIERYFPQIEWSREYINFPPAYVLACSTSECKSETTRLAC